MEILVMTIVNFFTQLAFIYLRTINVKATAGNYVVRAMASGGLVHIVWLISISLSTYSVTTLFKTWEWSYIPIPLASLVGGLIGTYFGMQEKMKTRKWKHLIFKPKQ